MNNQTNIPQEDMDEAGVTSEEIEQSKKDNLKKKIGVISVLLLLLSVVFFYLSGVSTILSSPEQKQISTIGTQLIQLNKKQQQEMKTLRNLENSQAEIQIRINKKQNQVNQLRRQRKKLIKKQNELISGSEQNIKE